ncbi:MAG: T9SS type A sorting domain-containing protein [Bacteroidia bacterium]
MRKFTLLLCLLSTTLVGWGQNLVPNGGFEQYSGCPPSLAQLDSCLFWMNPATNIYLISGTPDYFNSCNSNGIAGVPSNVFGYQITQSGNAYCGIYLFSSDDANYREYIEVPLISSLIINNCYHFEMKVSLADIFKYTTDAIGAYFSVSAITGINNYLPLPFTPQFNNITGNNPDSSNWTLVGGNYIAQGGESFLIIGNFKDDMNTDTIVVNSSSTDNRIYLYIDDVSLTPCATGINETSNNTSSFTISPNPAGEELNVQCSMFNVQEKEIKIYDMMGKEVLKSAINLQSSIINIQSLNSGIYFIEINGVRKKFVKSTCR